MDNSIMTFFTNFQQYLVLIAVVLTAVTCIARWKTTTQSEKMRSAFTYFLLFPVTIWFVWQTVLLIFFPQLAATMERSMMTPLTSELGLFNLAIAILSIMALSGVSGMRLAIVIICCCYGWGTFLVHMVWVPATVANTVFSMPQVVISLLLPAVLLYCYRRESKERRIFANS